MNNFPELCVCITTLEVGSKNDFLIKHVNFDAGSFYSGQINLRLTFKRKIKLDNSYMNRFSAKNVFFCNKIITIATLDNTLQIR